MTTPDRDDPAHPVNIPLVAGGALLLAAAAIVAVMMLAGGDDATGDQAEPAGPDTPAVLPADPLAEDLSAWADVDIDLSEVVIEASGVPVLRIGDAADDLTPAAFDDRIDDDGTLDVDIGVTTSAVEDGRFVSYWSPPSAIDLNDSVDTTDIATRYARAVAAAAGADVDPVTGPPRPRLTNPDGESVQVGWDLEVAYRFLLDDGPDAWIESLAGSVTIAGDGTVVAWDLPVLPVTADTIQFDPIGGDEVAAAINDGQVLDGSSVPPSGTFRPRHASLATDNGTDWRWRVATTDQPGAELVIVAARES
ncbi:hypothetical protein DVS28_b0459 (plasmid) [Euzebya pacifica]|uniref:Uncharacterized protein n=1 Tax=Euzebya pacifica TaxID=1608957 RepID=A0A346Y6V2_9ACTN|nr:hypothetical protein DVS28_b0459 [Euzebya pacifica]